MSKKKTRNRTNKMRTSVKTQNVSAKSQAAPKAREAVKPQLSVEEDYDIDFIDL